MSYDFPEQPVPTGSPFALRLRMLRSAAGMTPHALAREAGFELAHYYAMETGRCRVTAAALVRLLPALGVDSATFFDPD